MRCLFVCVCSCFGCFGCVCSCLLLNWTLLSSFVCGLPASVCYIIPFAVIFVCRFVCLFDGVRFCVLVQILLTWFCCCSSVHRFDPFVYVVYLFVCSFLFWVCCVCLLLFVSELDAFVFFCLCFGLLLFTILCCLLCLLSVCLFVFLMVCFTLCCFLFC